jgi:hypothetical protein
MSRARHSLGGSTSARRGVRCISKYKTKIDQTIDFRATFCGLRASAYIRLFSVTGGPLHLLQKTKKYKLTQEDINLFNNRYKNILITKGFKELELSITRANK